MPSGVVVGAGGPPRPRPPPPPAPARIQMPEKSTLPSAVRGAGASRFGFPSAVRGTPGVGYDGHCAPIEGASVAIRSAITPACPESPSHLPTSCVGCKCPTRRRTRAPPGGRRFRHGSCSSSGARRRRGDRRRGGGAHHVSAAPNFSSACCSSRCRFHFSCFRCVRGASWRSACDMDVGQHRRRGQAGTCRSG